MTSLRAITLVAAAAGMLVALSCSGQPSVEPGTQNEAGTRADAASGAGGASAGATLGGSPNTAGASPHPTAGGGAAAGAQAGGGGAEAAGAPGGGQAGANAGGSSGGACGDTQSNWRNCGSCGHRCRHGGRDCDDECCVAGVCAPAVGECLSASSGFATCAAACASMNQRCEARGCTVGSHVGVTWIGWDASITGRCKVMEYPDVSSLDECDVPLTWGGSHGEKRCCCSDD